MNTNLLLMDKRTPAGDMDRPPMRQTWYVILIGQVMKDPTLASQLDVGPPPQHQADLDVVMQRMQALFLVRDPDRLPERQFCGIAGALLPPTSGSVLYRTPIFASVLPVDHNGQQPHDVESLAAAYFQLAEYLLFDRLVREVEARALEGVHVDALTTAGFQQVCKIPRNVLIRRKPLDQFVFVKTGTQ